jgi:succinyl-diaminopimelate desuccinylase
MTTLQPRPAPNAALADKLLWLCAVASPIGEEDALCTELAAYFAGRSAQPVRRYLNSIVVPWSRPEKPRWHIALCGHTDTVRTENGPARMDGDRIFGSGASDMKSGLAVMMHLADQGVLPADVAVTLVFYAREEGPFADNELGPVLDQDAELRAADLAVCLEPSDNKVHFGCCGSLHATLTVLGKTGHSARPWEGDSAVTRAAPLIADIAAKVPEETRIGELVYRSVYTITQASDGGRGRNVVPDKFIMNLNHRFAPTYTVAEAQANLLQLVAGRAEVAFTDLSPGCMPSAEHPLVQSLLKAGVAGAAPKQAWTDVARLALYNIAAINFGPGENAQAHQKNESTSVKLVEEGYRIFERWFAELPARAPEVVVPAK